ncbi:MAG: dethiobiotin synthase, partial [Planctomycetes bacterium]|nr:dethiobiotin synthase [Planctomycetota bacterium]
RGARLIVELAGGLLVPYRIGSAPFLQADWLARVRPRIALVARAGLGTLNHTLLTLEALRARALEPELLLLVGAPHPENAATLRDLAGVAVQFALPPLEPLDGAALERWLAAQPLAEALR